MAEIKSIYAPQVEADLKKVFSELEKHHKLIIEMSKTSIDLYGGRQAGNPTELKNAIKAYEELAQKQKELTEAKRQSNTRTSEEIVNQRVLAQNADRQTKANSALVGAYARLNAQHQIAMQRVRDLTVSYGSQHRATVQAQKDFDVLDKKIKQADNAVRVHNRNVGNYKSALGGLSSLMGAFGVAGGLALFAQITTDTIRLIKELQSLNLALQQVSGTQADFTSNLSFIQETSENLGLSINDLTRQFTQFYVSAKDKLARQEIEDIFTSIAKAGATMGLSLEQQNRAFLAINQMMSKGTVQAEELRGQLGEALPGAFTIMAKSMGVTEKELSKMLQQGQVLAKDVLPAFARELEKAYGIENITNVQTLTAQTNRLSNAWTNFVKSFDKGDGIISKFLTGLMSVFTNLIKDFTKLSSAIDDTYSRIRKAFLIVLPQNSGLIKAVSDIFTKIKDTIPFIEKFEKVLKTVFTGLTTSTPKALMIALEVLNVLFGLTLPLAIERAKTSLFLLGFTFTSFITLLKNTVPEAIKLIMDFLNPFESADSSGLSNAIKKSADDYLTSLNKIRKGHNERINDIKANFKATKEQAEKEIALVKALSQTTAETEKNSKATKDNSKAKEKQREMVVGSVEWLEAEISKLKELQRQQSTTTDEYDKFNTEINTLVETLDLLINKQKEVKKQSEDGLLSEEDLAKLSEQMEAEADYFLDMAKEKLDNAKQIYESFGSDFIRNAGLTETFKILEEGLSKFGDNWEAKAIVIMEATQEMFNFIANLSQAHFEQEYNDLERQKEISIQFAGESTEAREEIEKEYERRRKEIQIREAKAKRSQAMFNIGIDMAQAIMRAWAQNPITAPVFTAIIGALGVAQIAAVASQPLPQFYKGTDNAPEGFAEVGERGRELIKDGKSGQWRLAEKRSVDFLTKGSTVLTNANTEKVLNFHAFNKGLSNTLVENNIDFYPIESKIDKLTNAILNKESLRIIDDSNGRRYYEEKNGQIKSLNNARLEIKQRVF